MTYIDNADDYVEPSALFYAPVFLKPFNTCLSENGDDIILLSPRQKLSGILFMRVLLWRLL